MEKQLYETAVIFRPFIEFEKKIKEYEQIFKNTTDHIYVKNIGLQKLSLPSKKFAQGYYVLFAYHSDNHWVNTELDLKFRQDEDVLKFITAHLEESLDGLSDDYRKISLIEQDNKSIDAIDVLLGLTNYYRKEV